MIISRHLNSRQNQNIRTANESFERLAKLKYLGTKLTNQNDNEDEINSRFNSGNACYYSVQNLLPSCLISKNLKIKIHKTVFFLLCCMGAKLGLSLLMEEHRLGFFENRALRHIWTSKGGRWIME
jgi:hypothetical protein